MEIVPDFNSIHIEAYLTPQHSGFFDFSGFAALSWRKRLLPPPRLSVDVQNFQNKGTDFHKTLLWKFLLKFINKFQFPSKLTKYLWGSRRQKLKKKIFCAHYTFSANLTGFEIMKQRGKSMSLRDGSNRSTWASASADISNLLYRDFAAG